MSADRANKICRKFAAFIYIVADLAAPADDLLVLFDSFRLGFYMVLVISIGKWCICIQQLRIHNFCNEQSMCSQIMLLYDFSTDDSTGMPSHVRNVIAVPWGRDSIELVYISAGLETEVLDRFKGTLLIEQT